MASFSLNPNEPHFYLYIQIYFIHKYGLDSRNSFKISGSNGLVNKLSINGGDYLLLAWHVLVLSQKDGNGVPGGI